MSRRRFLRPLLGFIPLLLVAVLLGVSDSARSDATANAIQVENAKPGTPGWDDFASGATQDALSGFASKISVNHGDSVDLYVTTTAASFTIDVFRMGWYGGAGARLVQSLGSFPGVHQAIPPPDPVTGMVACTNWTKTTTLNIPSSWVTGAYLAKLTASNGNKSFIFFVVRNDGGTEPILFQTSVTTYQAYNAWGGVSLYTNTTNNSIYKYPAATKVSFDRPFDPQDSNGAGQFLAYEYPFLRWAEKQGYDLSYITDVDTHTNVNPLTNHRTYLSIGHDEYWSKGMRDNVANAISNGMNAAFFSANTAYWQIRFEPNSAGVPNRVEVGYKGSATFNAPPGPDPQWNVNNAIVTTRWRDDPVNLPENGLLGVMYQDQVQRDYPYVVQNAGNWIYAGTGFTNGQSIPGIVGYEYDKTWNNGFSPPGLTVLSNSPVVGCCEGSGNSFANSTLYTAPSGAQVFASGTIQWSWGLDNYSASYANAGIQKTTANILDAFSAGSTGPAPGVGFSTNTLDFGQQPVAIASNARTVTLQNVGTAALSITGVSVTGANAAEYGATSTCPLAPATLAAGATCDISVTFTPAAAGTRTAALSVADNAAGSPHTVQLTGVGSLGPPTAATAMPLISRNVPAFASSSLAPASSANDNDYSTYWTGAIPSWLAYDLSSVPAAQRGRVLVGWYNDPQTSPYDHTYVGEQAYNSLRDYTIEANAAAGGGSAPSSGWVTLATVSGNHYHSRQHVVDMTGYNWLRINITAGDGSGGNSNASFNMDVHDASAGAGDSWTFFGDSITMDALHHEPINGTGNFSQLVNAAHPGYYPSYENSGIGGTNAHDGATQIASWLSAFPGKYVGLAFGTNDANGCGDTNAFYNDYAAMVVAVIKANKVPIVPTIPWARTANIQSCGPGYNAKLQALYTAYPEIVKGPDFWAYFQTHQSLISSDDLHPTAAGNVAYRQLWVTATSSAYGGGASGPAVTLTPSSLTFASQPVGSTSTAQTASVKNTGTSALTISGIATTGANASDFAATNDCPVAPATLAAGASCTISVTFTPGGTGSRSASVQISDDASGSPQTISLTGTGASTTPAVTLTPTSLTFASQVTGTTSAAQTITVRNSGGGALSIASISVTGANASEFGATSTCPIAPSTLAAGATCAVNVTFTPSSTGTRSASVQLTDTAADSPQLAPLTGTGTGPSTMALDKSLGTKTDNVAGSTMTLATAAAAAPGTRAVLFVVWNGSTATLASVSGGGLTWTVDSQVKDANNDHVAIASAAAPLGLASGTVLTATFSASVTHGLISGASFAGLASTSPVDAAATRTQAGVTAWSAPVTTTNAQDLVVGFSVIDANATSTAAPPNTEIHDFGDSAYWGWATSVYQITSAAGTATAAGTWSTASGSVGNATAVVAYKAAAAAPPAPGISLTPTSLSFGSQQTGTTSAPQSSTLKNTGTAALTVSSITAAGTNAADFAVTSNCPISPATLAAGATCLVNTTFAPSATGARSASVQIVDNATGSPHSLGLSGTGTAPAVSTSPTSIDFGSQIVGTTSAAQNISVSNTGTAPLSISGISTTGEAAGDYLVSSSCPLLPATLPAGSSCTISVRFAPSVTGSRGASVRIQDNAAGSPQSIGLLGTGAAPAPAVSLAPSSLTFGTQKIGTSSSAQSATVQNTGSSPLTISGIAATGAAAADFPYSTTCPLAPATLAPAATCTVSVTFAPTAGGSRTAAIQLTDDAANSPQSLTLSGTGATPAPALTLTPPSLSFGSVRVGTSSSPSSASLQNTGDAPLTITSITPGGASPGDFFVVSDCPVAPVALSPGAVCSISASFSPTATGVRSALVAIVDDAAGSPHSLGLSGTGTAPAVSLSTTSLAFGSQLVGTTSASRSSTLTNTGNAPLSISSIAKSGANASEFANSSTCPIAPATLAAGASCTISSTFAPTATGSRTAAVQVTDDAAGSPRTISLTGTGTTSAIAFDKSLGTHAENTGGANMKHTTTAAAAAGTRVFVFIQWSQATRTLTSVSGGGLTWTVDVQAKQADNEHLAIASANAPAGLASGTVITASFSGSVSKGLMSAASFGGIAATTPLDTTASASQAGVRNWTATISPTNGTDLLLGFSTIDANATSTPTAPAVELHDFGNSAYYGWATTVYQTTSAPGATTVAGTWSANSGAIGNLTVVAAYRAG